MSIRFRSSSTLNDFLWPIFLNIVNFFSHPIDYESPLPIFNETDYQYHPYARNGFNYPHNRQVHDRSPSYRLHQSYGNIITHRSDIDSINSMGSINTNNNDRDQFDYNDEYNRESNVNFYDNKYYDNLKMHR